MRDRCSASSRTRTKAFREKQTDKEKERRRGRKQCEEESDIEINVLSSFPSINLNSHLIFQELELVHGIKLKMFCTVCAPQNGSIVE